MINTFYSLLLEENTKRDKIIASLFEMRIVRNKYLNKVNFDNLFQIDLVDLWKIYDLHYYFPSDNWVVLPSFEHTPKLKQFR